MAGTQVLPAPTGSSFSSAFLQGFYGDGSDGDYTVLAASTITMNREYNWNNLTVQATGTLKPAGFVIVVKNTLTNAGSINDNGLSASGSTNGAALVARQYLGAASGAGSAGRNTTGAGTLGGAIAATSYNAIGSTPNGGAGGQADGVNLGGGAGVATTGSSRWASRLIPARGASAFNGGAGGGSGGCNVGTGTAASGGGGSGGGIVLIEAKTVVNSGTISADGGKGGDAAFTGDGKAGGGGGGGGGLVGFITQTQASSIDGVVTANGGAGGNGANGGTGGSTGVVGTVAYLVLA